MPLTVHEYDEFGHVADPLNPTAALAALEYIKTYCPYTNLIRRIQNDVYSTKGTSEIYSSTGGGDDGGSMSSSSSTSTVNGNHLIGLHDSYTTNDTTAGSHSTTPVSSTPPYTTTSSTTTSSSTSPHIFISTGLKDTRVSPLESINWAYAMRQLRGQLSDTSISNKSTNNRQNLGLNTYTDTNTNKHHHNIYLHILQEVGHEGPFLFEDRMDLMAQEIVFLENCVNR